jgi:hypothetical protein
MLLVLLLPEFNKNGKIMKEIFRNSTEKAKNHQKENKLK